ncbi:MAG TPA: sporangiospore maturation cell wall hydrolase GsmA [Pilimelia sp.]|nr:sporangiospore maturation cell wall hydrolase GsmA [Pilimelia sp.]
MPPTLRRLLLGALTATCATAPSLVAVAPPAWAAEPRAHTVSTVAATVRVDGVLRVRTGPSTATAPVGTVRDGARLAVFCAVPGQQVRGSVRTTAQWDRIGGSRYVSHAYVRTAAAVPSCAPPAVTGTVRSADGPVRLRTGPSTAFPVHGSAAPGTRLSLACATTGEFIAGATATKQWDRLSDGRYVAHAYVSAAALPRCAAGTVPASPPAQLTNGQFIAAAVPGAQRGWREFGVPPSVTIAQAILESGWGRSALAATDHNYFGIKCFGGPGPIARGCHTYRTTECDAAGRCFPTEATFRTYAVAADSYRDHGRFLRHNSRYARAFAYTRSADAFLWHIWKAGYATDPDYYRKVTGLMAAYDLDRYDTWR